MNTSHSITKKIPKLVLILFIAIIAWNPLFSKAITETVDLSLAITVDNPFPKIGERVTFTISVENEGTSDATGISVKSLIPTGHGNASCVSLDGRRENNFMVWENLSVDKGTKLSFVYHAEIMSRGEYNTLTEITAAHQDDVDSTPNNGADNDNDGLVGSCDLDDSFDEDDEDDGDDVIINILSSTLDSDLLSDLTKVTVYPNPSSDQVNIEVFNPSQAKVEVLMYSQVGQLINKQSEVNENTGSEFKETIEVSSLRPGRYLFNVTIGETSYIKTVVIGR